MAQIVKLHLSRPSRYTRTGGGAEIVLFPGVRYERHADAQRHTILDGASRVCAVNGSDHVQTGLPVERDHLLLAD